MDGLPSALYRGEQAKKLDTIAIQQGHVSSFSLMHRAGQVLLQSVYTAYPNTTCLCVFTGSGNNAGDGYVAATLALAAGISVTCFALTPVSALKNDAKRAADDFIAAGGQVSMFSSNIPAACDLILDAIFGIGLNQPIIGEIADAVACINASAVPVLSADIPSGLCPNTGNVRGIAVKADTCVCFIALKQGLFTAAGRDHATHVLFDDLQVPDAVYAQLTPTAYRYQYTDVAHLWPTRAHDSHKGHHGHVVLIGGQPGMAGAIRLAAEAALRAGAGRCSIITHPHHAALLDVALPEVMCYSTDVDVQFVIDSATACVIGPGLGQSAWAQLWFDKAMRAAVPKVIDADALTFCAHNPPALTHTVLTPHPGEAGRLLSQDAQQIQADRFAALDALVRRYACTIVLKGSGTLMASPDMPVQLCHQGNPGMATAGMGDVLAGLIGSLLAQHIPCDVAARIGVALHASAADTHFAKCKYGLLPSDVIQSIPRCLNDIPKPSF